MSKPHPKLRLTWDEANYIARSRGKRLATAEEVRAKGYEGTFWVHLPIFWEDEPYYAPCLTTSNGKVSRVSKDNQHDIVLVSQ